ncbi:hypothetical protein E4U56_000511 [Claviceps arundinis]|uniref:Uncharacterized protein n=1 Tax=Claviceps arundinis TaxID=1623583 RepID=A0A9P7N173_9HYPO|nr:hypothetical protein E4U56_000511 [Claviceps arundinis]
MASAPSGRGGTSCTASRQFTSNELEVLSKLTNLSADPTSRIAATLTTTPATKATILF